MTTTILVSREIQVQLEILLLQFDAFDVDLDSKITAYVFHHLLVDVTEFGQVISACRSLFYTHFLNSKVEFNMRQTNELTHTLVVAGCHIIR